uniref:DNA-directed RNA polymerase n=1 Tax=viral metagenome TaxID=1070528 RepID=A0A6C0DIK0_9ZZZZ
MAEQRSMEIPRRLLDQYFQTTSYPYTRHHLDSYNQFLESDLPAIIQSQNPLIIVKDLIKGTNNYEYTVEIYVGGLDGKGLSVGTPTLQHMGGEEVRLLFPNEARLRNLTYSAGVYADLLIRVKFAKGAEGEPSVKETTLAKFPLFEIPVMLHSKPCLLYNKPNEFLQSVGECPYDQGGYFIINGTEKVLITHQEQAFNTLYIQNQEADPQISNFSSISCLSPETRQVRRVTFAIVRKSEALHVGLPFVRKSIPICVLFRALGLESDQEIVQAILPSMNPDELKLMEPFLIECFRDAYPILDTFSAIQYIKTLTKGFGEAHVLDIIHNQMFTHVPDSPGARAVYLGDCVRKIYRVYMGLDGKTDRDDTRNQRCLTSGFLTQMLFQGVYKTWMKAVGRAIDEEYNYNVQVYKGENFMNIFAESNAVSIFRSPKASGKQQPHMLTNGLMRGFKGKWGSGLGDEKSGVLQALSRLSYIDFMSHCRRVVLEFDTGMKLTGPRHLHTSQYGYFCTNETPGGASIGITKNLSVLTSISTGTPTKAFLTWLFKRGFIMGVGDATGNLRGMCVPVFLNNGLVGYTLSANELTRLVKLLKWTACLSASVGVAFFISDRRILINFDEGRPGRPLLHMEPWKASTYPKQKLAEKDSQWRDMVMGFLPQTKHHGLSWTGFLDPLAEREGVSMKEYIEYLSPYSGLIEYVDPYEHNETFIVNFMEQATDETTHVEVHPSTIMSAITSLIPFSHHNQSVRNQLGDSQSKQGISVYASNAHMRYDNQAHILTNGSPPLVRTLYYDYLGQGRLPYGSNVILAMGMFAGYNQEDGIVINHDALQRGLFNSVHYRSYNIFEEDDEKAKTRTRIANPKNVPGWTDLKPGMDYSQLDDRGIVRVGAYVDENTIIVGRTMELPGGKIADSSEAAQVWTHGRVESVVILVNNKGLRIVKIRCVEYRVPELGDKFSNRHGQKGTIGMVVRSHDLPRTIQGIVPDMIMNTHAIPSRMTIGHVIEMVMGKIGANVGAIADGTAFTDDGKLTKQMNVALEQLGFEKFGNEILYDGTSGKQLLTDMFIGPIFSMRLKHMVEDKWNARGKGRREQRTHQPTGGRGAQGGLRIGEMERDAIVGHGISAFVNESYMLRSDGVSFRICKGCGTIPIENPKTGLFVCPLCTGPVNYIGSGPNDLELIPPIRKTMVAPVVIEMPYAFKLLSQELETYMNIGMRIMTEKDMLKLNGIDKSDLPPPTAEEKSRIASALPKLVLPEAIVPEYREIIEGPVEASPELLMKLGATPPPAPRVSDEDELVVDGSGVQSAIKTAADIAAQTPTPGVVPGTMVQTSQGQMFQPNPTTVTVVPPARSIQVVGGPEEVVADEDLETIPSVLPRSQPQQMAQPAQIAQPAQMAQPGMMVPQQGGFYQQPFQGQYYGSVAPINPQMANPYGQGFNMSQSPLVYASSQPQPAQLYTSGVPGAPPTIAVNTDGQQMGGFMYGSGPRPMRNNITLKRKSVSFGGSNDEESQSGSAPGVKVTVFKGS